MDAGSQDVDVVLGQHTRNVRQQRLPVQRFNLDFHEEHAGLRRRPVHINDPVRLVLQVGDVGAVGPVY
jgi:hypothetical protein